MRVVYATDGGAAAVAARRLVELLADRDRVAVRVVAVVPSGAPQLRHLSAAFQSDAARRRTADAAAEEAHAQLAAAGFDVDITVVDGRPAQALVAAAEEVDADLIVAGSGTRWVGGRLLGSVSTSLLHTAPQSVLVVHDPPPGAPAHVVVGTDGSDQAARAVAVATDFLDPDRCAVTVVAVAKLIAPTLSPPYTGYATSAPTPEVKREVLAPAREHADHTADLLTAAGFDTHVHVVLGHPVKRLLAEVDHHDAAVAIVGSRGLDAVDRAALGSVSDQIVRHARAALVGR